MFGLECPFALLLVIFTNDLSERYYGTYKTPVVIEESVHDPIRMLDSYIFINRQPIGVLDDYYCISGSNSDEDYFVVEIWENHNYPGKGWDNGIISINTKIRGL